MNKAMNQIASAVQAVMRGESNGASINGLYRVNKRNRAGDGAIECEVDYRGTFVALVTPTRIWLNTGGWFTVTTKRVMNAVLQAAGCPAHIYQHKYQWYIDCAGGPQRFDNRDVMLQVTSGLMIHPENA